MEQTVLVNVKVEGTENEARVDSLTQSIIELQNANKQLAETNKALAKAEGDNTKAIVENAKQIEFNKQKLTENTAERKGLIQSIVAEDNSIKALSIRNANLIKERNLINTSTDEGRKRINAINTQLDKNNEVIKNNSSALEKQRLNIGNYASALDKIAPGLSGMIQGIQGATTAGKAFIATPIGAVLAAVAAAVGVFTQAIKFNDATADLFGKRWDQISAVFDVVLRRVGLLGDALVSLVQGDFSAAADKAAAAFSGVNDELGRAIFLSGELADRQDALDDSLNKFNATEKARQNQVDKLIIQSKDLSKSEKERLALSTKAESILNQLTKERIELAKRQSDIDIEAIGLKHNAQRELNETTQEYGLRLLENSAIGGEEAEKIAAAIRSTDEAEAESIRTLEKLQNQQNKLLDTNSKQIETQEGLNIQYEVSNKELEKLIENLTKVNELSDLNLDIEAEQADQLDETTEKAINQARLRVKWAKTESETKANILSSYAAQAASIAQRDTAAYKALNSARAGMDAYAGAARALKDFPAPLSYVFAAISIASGLAQVARINAIQFAKGGIAAFGGVLNGPSHAHGGIPFAVGGRVGFEAEGGEAIINKRSTAMFKPILSQINQAGGGRSFATGGMLGNEVRTASVMASSAFNASELAGLVNQVKTVLVLQDFEAVQNSRDTTVNKATVLG